MKRAKKILALTLAFLMVVTGLYYGKKENVVKAESKTTSEVELSMLNVKFQTAQTPEDDGTYVMRFVSSVDSLDYSRVGFDVSYKEGNEIKTKSNSSNQVFERIDSTTEGVEYYFSSKIIDASSKYFITAKMAATPGVDYTVRSFVITMDGEKIYGPSRCVAVEDGLASATTVNATFESKSAVAVGDTIKANDYDATVIGVTEDGMAHVRINVAPGTLKSATKFEFKKADDTELGDVIHRNYHTSYAGTADTTWYDVDPSATDFMIATNADLYGLVTLSASNNFAGKNVYVVADIAVNKGTSYAWSPISTTSKPFAGTFDGQDHTISGINQTKVVSAYGGMFASTAAGSVVQNFRLEDSTFTHTGTGDSGRMGSIVGLAYGGTFKNIYSNAKLTSGGYGTAGIAGVTAGNVSFFNCWYDGELKSTTDQSYCRAGGIAGWVDSGTLYVEHCLNTGSIYAAASGKQAQIGGLVGSILENVTKAVIRDSVNTGSVDVASGTSSLSSIVGLNKSNGTVVVSGTYATIESCVKLQNYPNDYMVQTWSGKTTNKEQMVMLSEGTEGYASIMGAGAYSNTVLDFNNYWSAVKDGTPVLTSFVTDEEVMDVSNIERKVDDKAVTAWYTYGKATGTEADPYVIESAAELYGFANIVNGGTSFEGKYVVLGSDITVNTTSRDTWGTTAPLNSWTPIGTYNKQPFKGNLNGQGYTISGIYQMRTTGANAWNGLFSYIVGNGVIENFSLKNSSFSYTGTQDGGRMGSIVAWADGGTFRNIYSDAHLLNSKVVTGGIVGLTNGTVTISNCWFAGIAKTTGVGNDLKVGGILGWAAASGVVIEHCLNSGNVHCDATANRPLVGGLVGIVDNNVSMEIKDCLNSGLLTTGGAYDRVATLVGSAGAVGGTSQLIIHKTYATKESCGIEVLDAYTNTAPLYQGGVKVADNVSRPTEQDLKGINGYKNTILDFDDYWTAVEGSTPILTSFVTDENVISVDGIDRPVGYAKAWASKAAGTAQDPLELEDAADFAYFIALANEGSTPRYKGVYFKLVDDIIWNASDRDTWGTTAPLNSWTPIGSSSIKFGGNFDGCGYEIRGLYQTAAKSGYYGLFSHTDVNCVIENLSITNSVFKSSTTGDKSRMGTFAGWAEGTFRNLYSDINFTNSDLVTGGIVGVTVATTNISNCWFNGEINSTTNGGNLRAAGIIGWVAGGPVTMKHCLNSGAVRSNAGSGKAPQQGGLIGYAETSTITIEDCLNTGVVSTAGATSQVSTLIGRNKSGTVTTIKNTYATIESCGIDGLKTQPTYYLYQTDVALTSENVAMVSVAGAEGYVDIKGYNGYLNTNLMFDDETTTDEFDGYWVAVEGKAPMLKTFAKKGVLELSTVSRAMYIENPETFAVAWDSQFEAPEEMKDFGKKKQFFLM